MHLKLIEIAKTIVTKLKSGVPLKEAIEHDKALDHEYWYLEAYLKTLNPDYKP